MAIILTTAFLLISGIFFFVLTHGQDTAALKLLYDRCLEFDEGKADSICYYATVVENQSKKIGFQKGAVLSLRLKGLCHELKSDYDNAID